MSTSKELQKALVHYSKQRAHQLQLVAPTTDLSTSPSLSPSPSPPISSITCSFQPLGYTLVRVLPDLCERIGCYTTHVVSSPVVVDHLSGEYPLPTPTEHETTVTVSQVNVAALGRSREQLQQEFHESHDVTAIDEQGWWMPHTRQVLLYQQ